MHGLEKDDDKRMRREKVHGHRQGVEAREEKKFNIGFNLELCDEVEVSRVGRPEGRHSHLFYAFSLIHYIYIYNSVCFNFCGYRKLLNSLRKTAIFQP